MPEVASHGTRSGPGAGAGAGVLSIPVIGSSLHFPPPTLNLVNLAGYLRLYYLGPYAVPVFSLLLLLAPTQRRKSRRNHRPSYARPDAREIHFDSPFTQLKRLSTSRRPLMDSILAAGRVTSWGVVRSMTSPSIC